MMKVTWNVFPKSSLTGGIKFLLKRNFEIEKLTIKSVKFS